MVLCDLVVEVERHAYAVVVAAAFVVFAVVHDVVYVVDVAFVWQTDDCDLGWMNHPRHRMNRMEMVMGTVVIGPLVLGSLFETLGSIHLRPIIVIVKISQVVGGQTRIESKSKHY